MKAPLFAEKDCLLTVKGFWQDFIERINKIKMVHSSDEK